MLIPESCARRLFLSSQVFSVSAVVAYLKGHLALAGADLLLLGTSLNYWRQPELGVRRNLDMFVVFVTVLYNLYKSRVRIGRFVVFDPLYVLLISCIVCIYHKSVHCEDVHEATTRHQIVHYFGAAVKCLMYFHL